MPKQIPAPNKGVSSITAVEGWIDLIETVEAVPRGKLYKIVLKKLRGPSAAIQMELDEIREKTISLFP